MLQHFLCCSTMINWRTISNGLTSHVRFKILIDIIFKGIAKKQTLISTFKAVLWKWILKVINHKIDPIVHCGQLCEKCHEMLAGILETQYTLFILFEEDFKLSWVALFETLQLEAKIPRTARRKNMGEKFRQRERKEAWFFHRIVSEK